MVMVTKTSASDTPVETVEPPPLPSSSPNTTSTTGTNSAINENDDDGVLHITDSCMRRIEALAKKRKVPLDEIYLRVYVDAGGCSGFQYKFEMTLDSDEAVDDSDDKVWKADGNSGARVVVDSASLELIQGSTIDFVQEMIKSAFAVVDNPKSESACGCGSSFAIKNFQANPALD